MLLGFAVSLLATACVAHPAPGGAMIASSGPASSRFGSTADLSMVGDSDLRPVAAYYGPRYPQSAREDGVEAQVVTAYVIDTTGYVEPRSITFLPPVPPDDFRAAVCAHLERVRYARSAPNARPRRQLVFQAFAFAVKGGHLGNALPDVKPLRDASRRMGVDSTVALLEPRPHCAR